MAAGHVWGGSRFQGSQPQADAPLPPACRQVVREHWERQSPQRLEDAVRSQHIPGTAHCPAAAPGWGLPLGMGMGMAPSSPYVLGIQGGFPRAKAWDTSAGHTLQLGASDP